MQMHLQDWMRRQDRGNIKSETMWSCLTLTTCVFLAPAGRSEQVCLESSDLLHTHLALAGMRFNYYYHYGNICVNATQYYTTNS